MRAIISIPARMKSSRLPGKVMAPIMGRPMLAYVIERLARNRYAQLVVSTTIDPSDDPIIDLCQRMGCHAVRGPETNLIERHALAMYEASADIVCLTGADDPFMDPRRYDELIDMLVQKRLDYVKTEGWPLGMNGWAWTRRAMEDAVENAADQTEREHVVPFWERRSASYPVGIVRRPGDDLYDRYRLTVDTPGDLELARKLFEWLYTRGSGFGAEEVISAVERNLHWLDLNRDELQGHAAASAIYDH